MFEKPSLKLMLIYVIAQVITTLYEIKLLVHYVNYKLSKSSYYSLFCGGIEPQASKINLSHDVKF